MIRICVLFLSYFIFRFVFFSREKAQPIPPELTAKLLGNRVAVSPIVTVEPRRRKFHKPITLTIPVPTAAGKGMINSYSGETPTLRLLCSITGKPDLHQSNWLCVYIYYSRRSALPPYPLLLSLH